MNVLKTVTEIIGCVERQLNSMHSHTDGHDYITRIITDLWIDVDPVSTVWIVDKEIEEG